MTGILIRGKFGQRDTRKKPCGLRGIDWNDVFASQGYQGLLAAIRNGKRLRRILP
jgi:hypothetical protein